MAKIRSAEDLDDLISSEIQWRKRELTASWSLAQRKTETGSSANLRAGVLLLYAHWEGWVKAVARLYVRFVNTQSRSFNELSEAFLAAALKSKIVALQEARKPLLHIEFASIVRSGLGERAALSESMVQTESNLSSAIFHDVVTSIGLPWRDMYTLRAKQIDSDLVFRRNSIAHGQYLNLSIDEFGELRVSIMEILEQFTDDVRNAAWSESFLA